MPIINRFVEPVDKLVRGAGVPWLRVRVQSSGFRVQGAGRGVNDSDCRVSDTGSCSLPQRMPPRAAICAQLRSQNCSGERLASKGPPPPYPAIGKVCSSGGGWRGVRSQVLHCGFRV